VVSVTGTGSGSFADRHVGSAKPVTVTGFGLTGADAGNYAIVQPTGLTANITQRAADASGPTTSRGCTTAPPMPRPRCWSPAGTLAFGDTPTGRHLQLHRPQEWARQDRQPQRPDHQRRQRRRQLRADARQPNTTAPSRQANLAVTGVTATSRSYDGTTVASLGGSATVAALGGDSISVTGTGSGSFADRHAGNAKPVTVSGYSLTGTQRGQLHPGATGGPHRQHHAGGADVSAPAASTRCTTPPPPQQAPPS
jgi:hypothetical protein